MIHWLRTAFSTYVLHVEHNNGYQWWSGIGLGSSISANTLHRMREKNCSAHMCLRIGRFTHPEHGHKVCKKHLLDPHQLHSDGKTYAKRSALR